MKYTKRIVREECKERAHKYFDDILGKNNVTRALDRRRKYAGR